MFRSVNVNCGVITLLSAPGFHNYHHAFPMDYATGEFGGKRSLITLFIDLMASVGQAHNLKSTPKEVVAKVKERIAVLNNNNLDVTD